MYDDLPLDELDLYRPDLLSRLPPFFREIQEFKALNDVSSYELGILNWQIEDILNQFFVDTATWGLSSLWEKTLDIKIDLNKSYEGKREIVKAKLRGSGTVTKALIKNVAQAFLGGEVDVIENFADYSFIIKFIGVKGIPKDLAVLQKALDDIKPAHLALVYAFRYLLINDIDEVMTLEQLEQQTLDKFAF